jgi:dTDP-glucose pyrophosphorylase
MQLTQFLLPSRSNLLDAMRAIEENCKAFVLIIDDEGRGAGMLTDGDLRRALLTFDQDFSVPVTRVMKEEFIFVSPEIPRGHVLDMMRAREIRQIPVLNAERKPVGFHFVNELTGNFVKPNHAVIMAGGKGTRLYPLTRDCPKPLLPVAGKPILEHIILHLIGHGIRTIWISVNYLAEMITAYFGDGSRYGCAIRYLHEKIEMGTGGSLSLLPAMEHPFLVLNGDIMSHFNATGLLEHHEFKGSQATICVKRHYYEVPFGVVTVKDECVTEVLEKPVYHYLVNAGIYALSPTVLPLIPKDCAISMPAVLDKINTSGGKVVAYESPEDWLDVGRPSELIQARGEA